MPREAIIAELQTLDARRAELEQQLADIDGESKTAPCPYCNSPLRVSDERFPARVWSEAQLAELDELTAEVEP